MLELRSSNIQILFCDSTSLQYWIGLYNPHQPALCGICGAVGGAHAGQCSGSTGSCCTCRASWTWIDGEEMSFDLYMNWNPNEPTGSHPTARLENRNDNGWKWLDGPSSFLHNYICKRPRSNNTESTPGPTVTQADSNNGDRSGGSSNSKNQ